MCFVFRACFLERAKANNNLNCLHFLWHSNLQRDWKGCQGERYVLTFGFMQKNTGDNRGPIGSHWRHDGPPHWLLHSQWGRDHLLPSQVHPPIEPKFIFKLNSYLLSSPDHLRFCANQNLVITFLLRFFISLRVSKAKLASTAKNRFENHLMLKSWLQNIDLCICHWLFVLII